MEIETQCNGTLEMPISAGWPVATIQRRWPAASRPENKLLYTTEPRMDAEVLRRVGWEIGENRPADAYTPSGNHAGLAMVSPYQGFVYWRILQEWVDRTAWQRGQAWHNCRLILRLYDVSYITFTGLNANYIQDHTLPALGGHFFFKLPRPGTYQLGEVGFLLTSGEFLPAARSQVVAFPPDTGSAHHSNAALLVNGRGEVEQINNVWDQERILRERRQPRLRQQLRIAAFAFAAQATGQEGTVAQFVSELAAGQRVQGHEVHVFVPRTENFTDHREVAGVHYHPLTLNISQDKENPLAVAEVFAQEAENTLKRFPAFDLMHLHEWMAGLVPGRGLCPTVLSVSSIETTRRNGMPPSPISQAIEKVEREVLQLAPCVLTPAWLRDKAIKDLELQSRTVRAFPMEGRLANEWEVPLDFGQVKMGIGLGPLDRLIIYVGPLEHFAGVDLLLEAMPTMLHRCGNLRLAFIGEGSMHGHLKDRLYHLGLGHAVRLLGHVEGPQVVKLVRSAEGLVLPSRCRVPFDDAVVDLARRAGRPVVTTHAGPAHLVRHEETGLVTYDNPGSMVWALDRLLGDPFHAERMGHNGRRQDGTGGVVWSEVARHYLELCAGYFPELRQSHSW